MERSNTQRVITTAIIGVVIFAAGMMAGGVYGVRSQLTADTGEVEISKVLNLYSQTRSSEVDFDQYWTVWDTIQNKYVDAGELANPDLFYGSLVGLVNALDDPYSQYFPPTEAKEFARDLAGEFEGIGAEVGVRNEQLQIIAPLPGSPAEQAGIRPGDRILAIDDKDTSDMSLDKAVQFIRGERGTVVTLTVTRNGLETATDIEITRDTINVPTVVHEQKEQNIDYIRISTFNEKTLQDFRLAVSDVVMNGSAGIILDLRSNPGGFLDTSVDVASEWIEEGVVVRERFGDGRVQEYTAEGKHRLADIPTVVLVDQGTASGAEIVAGALQDYDLATIVGAQTFGKGSVQDFEVLPDGSALKLTVAKWFTPSDRAIEGEGVAPDIVIEEMFAENADATDGYDDFGVQKAMEILTSNS